MKRATFGYVQVGPDRFPITDMCLVRSGLELRFKVRGPYAGYDGAITLFGIDGAGCWQYEDQHIPDLVYFESADCIVTSHATHVESGPTRLL